MKRCILAIILTAFLIGGLGCKLPSLAPQEPTSTPKPVIERVMYSLTDVTFIGDRAVMHIWDINSIEFSQAMLEVEYRGIKKLHLDVRSPGGSVVDMFQYLDLLRQFKEKGGEITSHCGGWMASAAVPIYLMGDHRTMDRNAWVMLHPHSLYGKKITDYGMYQYDTSKDYMKSPTQKTLFEKFNIKISEAYARILVERTHMSLLEAIKIIMPVDWDTNTGQWYFSAYEALEMGFCDKLV